MSYVEEQFNRIRPKREKAPIALVAAWGVLLALAVAAIIHQAGQAGQQSTQWVDRNPVTHCAPRGGVLGAPADGQFYCQDGTRWNETVAR